MFDAFNQHTSDIATVCTKDRYLAPRVIINFALCEANVSPAPSSLRYVCAHEDVCRRAHVHFSYICNAAHPQLRSSHGTRASIAVLDDTNNERICIFKQKKPCAKRNACPEGWVTASCPHWCYALSIINIRGTRLEATSRTKLHCIWQTENARSILDDRYTRASGEGLSINCERQYWRTRTQVYLANIMGRIANYSVQICWMYLTIYLCRYIDYIPMQYG